MFTTILNRFTDILVSIGISSGNVHSDMFDVKNISNVPNAVLLFGTEKYKRESGVIHSELGLDLDQDLRYSFVRITPLQLILTSDKPNFRDDLLTKFLLNISYNNNNELSYSIVDDNGVGIDIDVSGTELLQNPHRNYFTTVTDIVCTSKLYDIRLVNKFNANLKASVVITKN